MSKYVVIKLTYFLHVPSIGDTNDRNALNDIAMCKSPLDNVLLSLFYSIINKLILYSSTDR